MRRHKSSSLSFSSCTTFNLDEYLGLEGDHPQSYRAFMAYHLFQHIDIKPWNTHLLNGKALVPAQECAAYEHKVPRLPPSPDPLDPGLRGGGLVAARDRS